MVYSELIDLIQKKDTGAHKKWFDSFYGKLAAIALRYAKSDAQAESITIPAMHKCYEKLEHGGPDAGQQNESAVFRTFISECVRQIREIRSEYYVSSTVHATASAAEPLNLFQEQPANFEDLELDQLLPALQSLVPSQRLIYNLHVIDGFSLSEAATILESSEATVKSNLEKARYNLQKNIEKSLTTLKS